jgi:beta-glucosidase/6-phospho-beta-glucosidase/beta-galactosidase
LNHIAEDIENIKNLKMKSYSLTLSWTQIYENGPTERPSSSAWGTYLNFLTELKNNNIETVVTLTNWDLPNYFFIEGRDGWMTDETRLG